MKKRSLFAGFLALVMSVSMMSVTAFATESNEPVVDPVAKTVTVSNEDQFMSISSYSNSSSDSKEYPRTFSGWTVIIANDLNMTGKTWNPLVNFNGNMCGTVKEDETTTTISNLTVSASKNAGLCANSANGNFSDLTIADSTITSSGEYAGAFAGNGFTSSFDNCDVKNTTVKGLRFVGGVTGYSYGNIDKCDITDCTISSNGNSFIESLTGYGDNIGGVVGLLCEGRMTISDCHVTNSNVTGARQVGGIAGAALYGTTIKGCIINGGSVKATGKVMTKQGVLLTPCAGGIVGQFAAGSTNPDLKIHVLNNTVSNITISQSNTTVDEMYTGWAVGDANTRLTVDQYEVTINTQSDVTGTKGTTTVTLNEIGYIAANPSLPAAE